MKDLNILNKILETSETLIQQIILIGAFWKFLWAAEACQEPQTPTHIFIPAKAKL